MTGAKFYSPQPFQAEAIDVDAAKGVIAVKPLFADRRANGLAGYLVVDHEGAQTAFEVRISGASGQPSLKPLRGKAKGGDE